MIDANLQLTLMFYYRKRADPSPVVLLLPLNADGRILRTRAAAHTVTETIHWMIRDASEQHETCCTNTWMLQPAICNVT
jgi:hypothetical protein